MEEPNKVEEPIVTEVVQPPAETSEPPKTPEKPETPQKKRRISKKLSLILVACLLVIGGGVSAYFVTKKKPADNNQTTPTTTQQTSEETQTSQTEKQTDAQPVTMNGNTYHATPKKLDNLKFFTSFSYFGQTCDNDKPTSCHDMVNENDFVYYEIGLTKEGKKIIVAYSKPVQVEGTSYIALEESPSNYTILVRDSGLSSIFGIPTSYTPSATDHSEEFLKILAKHVTTDKNKTLAELTFPTDITVAGQKFSASSGQYRYFLANGLNSIRGSFFGELKDGQTAEKFGASGGYDFYRVYTKTESTFKVVAIYATIGTTFSTQYNLHGELSSTTENLPITWSSGEQTKSKYFSAGQGCGGTGYVIASNLNKDNLVAVGTSKNGQKIYQLKSSDPLATYLYEKDYAPGKNDDSWIQDASLRNLTVQQFAEKHAYFLVENALNEYVVFQRDGMFMRGGCGKPVVYLYPTQPTTVQVRVAADVIKSEPLYGTNGWQNVFAEPSGTLSYQGRTYDSLYWEGYGHGSYPDITSGSVVKSSEAPAVIRTQLAQQGLNQKEIADFMEFWAPKLPTTPYTRLTWFGTGLMNQLAPLTISPAPQTTIRVFLDFEGLQTPISLPAQTFRAPKRIGFTVVEWGGLLREGIR